MREIRFQSQQNNLAIAYSNQKQFGPGGSFDFTRRYWGYTKITLLLLFSPLLPAQHNQGRKHKGLIALLKNETPPLTCLHLRTLSEQRRVAPIHLFPLLPQSHVRCFSLAEDAGVGKHSPESCVLAGEDRRPSAWEEGSGEGTGWWHTTRATTGLASFEQCPGQFSPSQRLRSKQLNKNDLAEHNCWAWIQTSKTHPICDIGGQCFLGSVAVRREACGGNQTAGNPEVSRCGDILFLC